MSASGLGQSKECGCTGSLPRYVLLILGSSYLSDASSWVWIIITSFPSEAYRSTQTFSLSGRSFTDLHVGLAMWFPANPMYKGNIRRWWRTMRSTRINRHEGISFLGLPSGSVFDPPQPEHTLGCWFHRFYNTRKNSLP